MQRVEAVCGSSQGVAGYSRVRGLYQVALTIGTFKGPLSRCWNFALYPFCVVLSFGSPAWLMSSSGIRDGVCKVCSFWMKGAIEMEVFWCPTWRTAGGMSASGVTYWAWRGIKVKAWPNCVLANKDQLGHRKGVGREIWWKAAWPCQGDAWRMRALKGNVQVLGPGICDGEGTWGTLGG